MSIDIGLPVLSLACPFAFTCTSSSLCVWISASIRSGLMFGLILFFDLMFLLGHRIAAVVGSGLILELLRAPHTPFPRESL